MSPELIWALLLYHMHRAAVKPVHHRRSQVIIHGALGLILHFFKNYLHNNPHLINIHIHDDFDAYALQGLR